MRTHLAFVTLKRLCWTRRDLSASQSRVIQSDRKPPAVLGQRGKGCKPEISLQRAGKQASEGQLVFDKWPTVLGRLNLSARCCDSRHVKRRAVTWSIVQQFTGQFISQFSVMWASPGDASAADLAESAFPCRPYCNC